MAIKHVIAKGIGFSTGDDNTKFIPTHGFTSAAAVSVTEPGERRVFKLAARATHKVKRDMHKTKRVTHKVID